MALHSYGPINSNPERGLLVLAARQLEDNDDVDHFGLVLVEPVVDLELGTGVTWAYLYGVYSYGVYSYESRARNRRGLGIPLWPIWLWPVYL